MKQLFFLIFLFPFQLLAQNEGQTLEIKIDGLRNNKGTVYATLFNSTDGFPSDPKKAVKKAGVKVIEGNSIIFKNIPAGTYAVALLHDENDNNKMDTNFIGIPNEGYGASNDAKGTFGPPKFEDAKFDFKQAKSINIKITY